MSKKEVETIPNFQIKNKFATIIFEGKSDLTYVDLDKACLIERGCIKLYADPTNRPNKGEKLNKAATVIYNEIYPPTNSKNEDFTRRLKEMCENNNVRLFQITILRRNILNIILKQSS